RPVVLEALTRRYYRVRALEPFAPLALAGATALESRYDRDGTPRRLATAYTTAADLERVLQGLRELPDHGEDWVVDVALESAPSGAVGDEAAAALVAALAGAALPRRVRRVVFAVAQPGGGLDV